MANSTLKRNQTLNTQNGRAENRIPHTCLPRSARRATHTHRRSKSTTYHYPLHRNPSGPDRASSRAQLVGRGCTRPFARRTRPPLRHTWNYHHAGEEYGKRCRRSLTVASASAAHRARSPRQRGRTATMHIVCTHRTAATARSQVRIEYPVHSGPMSLNHVAPVT